MTLEQIKNRVETAADTPAARTALHILRGLVWALVLYVIVSRLGAIGWQTIANHLPTSAPFYAFIAVFYVIQPLGETIIFRHLWRVKITKLTAIMFRKRVYNFALMSYSGEAVLFLWARKAVALSDRSILASIKDNVVLSALVSNCATVLMVVFFLATGQMQRFFHVSPNIQLYAGLAAALATILAFSVLKFRSNLLALSNQSFGIVLAVHTARFGISLFLQAAIWAMALPTVPLDTWFVLATLQLVLTRVPFLPNQDLVFLALVVSVAGFVEAETGAVAGTFLAIAGLMQVLHLMTYFMSALMERLSYGCHLSEPIH
ncbi:MAG: hypothetical protein AAF221_00820 [Pseudomonadota bacterium]